MVIWGSGTAQFLTGIFINDILAGDSFSQIIADFHAAGQIGFRQNNCKLLTTIAGGNITALHAVSHGFSDKP